MKQRESWIRKFALITTGQIFSIVGSSAAHFAIIWWMTVQTGSAMTLTAASLIGYLPQALISPFAGVWVDRLNRKHIIMIADGVVALASAGLAIAFLIGTPSIAFIYAMLFIRSIGGTFHSPAFSAAVPMIVPEQHLVKVGGWTKLTSSGAYLLGPAIGALLMGLMPIWAVMLIDIIGAAFAIITLSFIAIPNIKHASEKINFIGDIKDGVKTIKNNKAFIAIIIPMLIACTAGNPIGSLLPLAVKNHFGGGVWHNSAVEIAFTVGALLCALLMGIFGSINRPFKTVGLCIFIMGFLGLAASFATPAMFIPFVVGCILMGMASAALDIPLTAYMQKTCPPQMLGKVLAMFTSIMSVCVPLGLAIAGPVAEKLGVMTWFTIAGVACLVAGIYALIVARKYKDYTPPAIEGLAPQEAPAPDVAEARVCGE